MSYCPKCQKEKGAKSFEETEEVFDVCSRCGIGFVNSKYMVQEKALNHMLMQALSIFRKP